MKQVLDDIKDIVDIFKERLLYFLGELTSQLYVFGTTTHSRYDYGIINESFFQLGQF